MKIENEGECMYTGKVNLEGWQRGCQPKADPPGAEMHCLKNNLCIMYIF